MRDFLRQSTNGFSMRRFSWALLGFCHIQWAIGALRGTQLAQYWKIVLIVIYALSRAFIDFGVKDLSIRIAEVKMYQN